MKRITAAFIIFLLVFSTTNLTAEASSFKDLKKTHWAYNTVLWAQENDLVSGYPDGTFKPNQNVSEAEFLTMFLRYFETLTPTNNQTHWADPTYAVANRLNYPTWGAAERKYRDKEISRERVAEIISAANGVNYVGKDAIQYLLNAELSKGKTGATVEGYKPADSLTRSEAVQFIKNVVDSGMKELKERPVLPSNPIDTPKQPLPANMSAVLDTMTDYIKKDSAYAGYTAGAHSESLSVLGTNGRAVASYSVAQSAGGNNSVISFNAHSDADLKLAVKMLQTVGVPVPDSFIDDLKEARDSDRADWVQWPEGKKYGEYDVHIIPDLYTTSQVKISFR